MDSLDWGMEVGAGRSPGWPQPSPADEQMLGAVGNELEEVDTRGYPQLRALSPRVPFPLSFGRSLPECLLAPSVRSGRREELEGRGHRTLV